MVKNVFETTADTMSAGEAALTPDELQILRQKELMSQRKPPNRRPWRFLKKYWFWILLIITAYGAWTNPLILNLVLVAIQFAVQILSMILLVIVQFGAIFWFMSRTKQEIIRPGDPKTVTFEDYKGQDRLVEMVKQWLALLYDRREFQEMGGRFINGLLLYGPPGTGKTLLAKCMAGEAGVAFISVEGSGFRGMFWGMDVLRMISFIRKARKLAREYGACIAFIDEIDAVGMSRGSVMGGNRPAAMGMGGMMGGGTGALTRLLYEMDGVEEKTRQERWLGKIYQLLGQKPPQRDWHVLFMGSTNRPDVLDPALTRPGRFDRILEVAAPDKTGRREIVSYYLDKIKHDESVDLEAIVQDTAWATPARIMAAITKDAVRLALFDGRKSVSQKDIDQAFQEQAFGLERPIEEMPEDQRRQLAYHEAGHAVAAHYFRPEHRIVRATIIGRSGSLGYVQSTPDVEEYVRPLKRFVADIMVSLAGHVAVKVFLGEHWTGAGSDFQNVRMRLVQLASFGYFGPPIKDPSQMFNGQFRSEQMEEYWDRLEDQCEQFVRTHAQEIEAVTFALLEKESLTGKEVLEIMNQASGLSENGHMLSGNGHEPTAVLPSGEEVEIADPVADAEQASADTSPDVQQSTQDDEESASE